MLIILFTTFKNSIMKFWAFLLNTPHCPSTHPHSPNLVRWQFFYNFSVAMIMSKLNPVIYFTPELSSFLFPMYLWVIQLWILHMNQNLLKILKYVLQASLLFYYNLDYCSPSPQQKSSGLPTTIILRMMAQDLHKTIWSTLHSSSLQQHLTQCKVSYYPIPWSLVPI